MSKAKEEVVKLEILGVPAEQSKNIVRVSKKAYSEFLANEGITDTDIKNIKTAINKFDGGALEVLKTNMLKTGEDQVIDIKSPVANRKIEGIIERTTRRPARKREDDTLETFPPVIKNGVVRLKVSEELDKQYTAEDGIVASIAKDCEAHPWKK